MPLYQDTQVNMVDLILLGEHREIKNVFLSAPSYDVEQI